MLPTTRRHILLGATSLALVSSSAAPAFAQASKPKRGGTLTGTWGGLEPQSLFVPAGGGSSPTLTATKIHEQLLYQALDLSFRPQLAESVTPAADFKSYTIKLRPNVKWHDGKPFTANDVVFSALKYWKPISIGVGLKALEDAVAVDDTTVRFVFNATVPEFFLKSLLAGRQSMVIAKHVYDGSDIITNPMNNTPVGTGPFKYKEWVRGSHVELIRNEEYWNPGLPYLDRLVIRWWRDAAARSAAFEAGQLDLGIFNPVPPPDIDRLQKTGRFQVTKDGNSGSPQTSTLEFNCRSAIFGKAEVRRALQHAFDRAFIADTIYFGRAVPAFGIIPPSNKAFYTDAIAKYPYDAAKAAKMLDAAGYPVKGGKRFKLRLLAAGWYEENGRIGQYLKQSFEDLDIEVDLTVPDRPTSYKRIYTDYDFDAAITNYTGSHELVPQWTQIFTSDNIIKGAAFRNATGYSNPAIDKLVEQFSVEVDADRRLKLAHEIQEIMAKDVPISSTVEFVPVSIAGAAVRNIGTKADMLATNWADVWLDR